MNAESGRHRTGWAAAVVAVLLFMAAWLPWHPPLTPLPTADIYTHLSVARHLVRGEGFSNDVTYPLSFAFPFARRLPQPLINRQPAYAVLLTLPYLAAGRDPHRTLAFVRLLQLLLLGLLVLTGTRALQQQRPRGALPWFVLLGASPLLAFAVNWGFDELPAGLLLLLLWLETRRHGPTAKAGVLSGLLVLFRLDLIWVPCLWWLLSPLAKGAPDRDWRRLGVALVVGLAVLSPWLVRNARLTGDPFFSLQSQAELVKDTNVWPGYSIYKNLTPQPLITALRDEPIPILRKAARGLQFFRRDLYRFFPPLLLLLFAAALPHSLWQRLRRGSWPDQARTAPALAAVTLLLLCLQYAFFDHSLRHLIVLLPVLAWEAAYAAGERWLWALLVCLTVLLPPSRLPGWNHAAREAATAAAAEPWQTDAGRIAADGLYFFDYSAGPWFLDRPGVWTSPAAKAQIPQLLNPSLPSEHAEEQP